MNKIYLVLLSTLVLGISLATYAVNRNKLASKIVQPYSNDNIHEWACNTVIAYDKAVSHTGGGCYDICDALSYKIETTGRAFHGLKDGGGEYKWNGDKIVPQGLGDEYWDGGRGYDLANACAITLNGAEW